MNIDEDIIKAKKCPYCGNKPEYVDSSVVYGRSYGKIYYCKKCNAYVGVHHRTSKKPLGRLADDKLRKLKREAHFYFDNLWIRHSYKNNNKGSSRKKAYKWLSEQLGIPYEYTHIGMFDTETCLNTIHLCKPYYKKK